jgi:hypothetical protein
MCNKIISLHIKMFNWSQARIHYRVGQYQTLAHVKKFQLLYLHPSIIHWDVKIHFYWVLSHSYLKMSLSGNGEKITCSRTSKGIMLDLKSFLAVNVKGYGALGCSAMQFREWPSADFLMLLQNACYYNPQDWNLLSLINCFYTTEFT